MTYPAYLWGHVNTGWFTELEKYNDIFSFTNGWDFKVNSNMKCQLFSLCLLSLKRYMYVFGDELFSSVFACNTLKYWFIVICFLLPVISASLSLFSFLLDINKLRKTEKYKCCDFKIKWCRAYFTLFYSIHLWSEVFPPKRSFSNQLRNYEKISYTVLDMPELINKCIHICTTKIKLL